MDITLANTLQAPNTVELYSVGKYSAVTKKHRLNALETPNLVNSKHAEIMKILSGEIKISATPNTPPRKKEENRHFLVPT